MDIFIVEVAQDIVSNLSAIQVGFKDLVILAGALITGGKLWQQIRHNSIEIAQMENKIDKALEKMEARTDRMEEHNYLVIEKVTAKLEDMGEKFMQFGQELRDILANHHTRLALLEKEAEDTHGEIT